MLASERLRNAAHCAALTFQKNLLLQDIASMNCHCLGFENKE